MPNTVAVFGANGSLGRALLAPLKTAHIAGQVKLVVLHRPSSNLGSLDLPSDVATRSIDLDPLADEQAQIASLKDLDLVISTVSFEAAGTQTRLIELLSKTGKETVFIPARYSARFDGKKYPALAPLENMMMGFHTLGDSLGVKSAGLNTGVFVDYFFGYGLLGVDVKGNTVHLNEGQKKNKFPISSVEYVGAALTELAKKSPSDISGKIFSAVEFWVSGDQLIQALETVHGSAPNVIDGGAVSFETDPSDPLGPVKAGYAVHWQDATFEYPNEVEVPGWQTPDLVQVVQRFKTAIVGGKPGGANIPRLIRGMGNKV